MSAATTNNGVGKSSSRAPQMSPTMIGDEKLGFEASVAALGKLGVFSQILPHGWVRLDGCGAQYFGS